MSELEIRVLGRPAPQGSKSFKGMRNGHAVLAESSKHAKPWRRDVETAAANAIRAWEAADPTRTGMWMPLDGPLALEIVFLLARPARPMNPDHPIGPPDLSKLVRSTEDALTLAGVVRDDSRFVREVVEKQWAVGTRRPGARIRVRAMSDQLAVL